MIAPASADRSIAKSERLATTYWAVQPAGLATPHDRCELTAAVNRQAYDPRLRNDVARTGNVYLFPDLDIPSSTVRTWRKRGEKEFVTLKPQQSREAELRDRVQRLERKLLEARAKLILRRTLIAVLGVSLENLRVPTAAAKRKLLRAIRVARKVILLSAAAEVLGISPARYYAWVEADAGCALPDTPSCPRTKPTQLTFEEVHTMRDMVTSKNFRHMSTRALALFAQRTGQVFAHPATWYRLIRERAWKRPQMRLYPPKPKIGLRVDAPNDAWHVDRTLIKLLDGTRTYLSCIIDNYSRRILAWHLADNALSVSTRAVLLETAKLIQNRERTVKVIVDDGSENKGSVVDPVFSDVPVLERIVAQIQISFSNSMIEAFFSRLKHGWLYINDLRDFATLEKLIAFYVQEHNTSLPHAAFNGQTPDEVYFGTGDAIVEQLAEGRARAREDRVRTNRTRSCDTCPTSAQSSTESKSRCDDEVAA